MKEIARKLRVPATLLGIAAAGLILEGCGGDADQGLIHPVNAHADAFRQTVRDGGVRWNMECTDWQPVTVPDMNSGANLDRMVQDREDDGKLTALSSTQIAAGQVPVDVISKVIAAKNGLPSANVIQADAQLDLPSFCSVI